MEDAIETFDFGGFIDVELVCLFVEKGWRFCATCDLVLWVMGMVWGCES